MKIKIGAVYYEIEIVSEVYAAGRNMAGLVDHEKCLIKIVDNLEPQAARQVGWHEIIHSILTQAGFTRQDERLVDALAYGIMGAIRDNPWLGQAPVKNKDVVPF